MDPRRRAAFGSRERTVLGDRTSEATSAERAGVVANGVGIVFTSIGLQSRRLRRARAMGTASAVGRVLRERGCQARLHPRRPPVVMKVFRQSGGRIPHRRLPSRADDQYGRPRCITCRCLGRRDWAASSGPVDPGLGKAATACMAIGPGSHSWPHRCRKPSFPVGGGEIARVSRETRAAVGPKLPG